MDNADDLERVVTADYADGADNFENRIYAAKMNSIRRFMMSLFP